MKKHLFVLLLILLHTTVALGQESMMRFKHLTIADGLSQSSALCMLQDKRGFLWIGTSDGLNRYDGYGIKVYRRSFHTNESLGNNYINDIKEDKDGNLWLATRNGLCKYNWATDSFTNYLRDSAKTAENHFLSLVIDNNGDVWCANILFGLVKFSTKTRQFDKIIDKYNHVRLGGVNTIAYNPNTHQIWVGTEKGVLLYDIATGTFSQNFLYFAHLVTDVKVSKLYLDNYQNLWIGFYTGELVKWSQTTIDGSFKVIKLPKTSHQAYGAAKIHTILASYNGDIWVGCASLGLFRLQSLINDYQITQLQHEPLEINSLSDNDIYSLVEDRNGLLWVGTYGGGVNQLNYQQNIFNYYRHKAGNQNSLLQSGVRSICEDKHGNLWVGTAAQGLSRFNRQEGNYEHFIYDNKNPHSLGANRINAILEDHAGVIWVGTGGGGLCRITYDSTTHQYTNKVERIVLKTINKTGKEVPIDPYVYVLVEDKAQRLWIGANNGLWILDKNRQLLYCFQPDKNNPQSLSDNQVRAISFDDIENAWIGTFHGGLNKLNLQTKTFKAYKHQSNTTNCLSDNAVSSIHVDKYGTLWIGTFGGGLNKFDIKTEHFEYITEEDGIANNVIYGVLEDKFNNLWLSTNRGLSRYNVLSKLIVNYNLNDGLQSDEFNANAYHEGKSGTFYFGGINGLTSFRPEFMQDTTSHSPLFITDFRLFNQSVKPSPQSVLQQNIVGLDHIELSHKDYVFAFEFAALNFRTPHRLRYAYKLEGFDHDWIYVSSKERLANYSNIPAGEYVFRVKTTNNNGAWEENKSVAIKVKVHPPIWATWWFRVMLLLIFILLLFIFYHYRTEQFQRQNDILEKLVDERTSELQKQREEIEDQRDTIVKQYEQMSVVVEHLRKSEHELAELNASKNKFFSILAHDLKSPLNSLGGFSSLLVNFADELSKEEIKMLAKDLDKNIKVSTKYLENLLTWARSQMNSIDFNPIALLLVDSVTTSVSLLEAHAQAKNILLTTQVPPHLMVIADSHQLQTILTNLINNAIKFTDNNGIVSITASAQTDSILLAIQDTGVGMSPTVADKIFRIDTKHSTVGTAGEKGTGLGLLLCKEFVEKNGGSIWVESEEDKGTTFFFTLPSKVQ